jgi:hypothetical protein
MRVAVVAAGQPARYVLERQLRQYGHAVEALLAVDGDIVAKLLEWFRRECAVLRLDLLQAEHVGLGVLHPGHRAVDAGAHAIDVPGRDLHAGLLSTSRHAGNFRARHLGHGRRLQKAYVIRHRVRRRWMRMESQDKEQMTWQ